MNSLRDIESGEATLDPKGGRFLMPLGIRNDLFSIQSDKKFVLRKGDEKCLNLFPLENWKEYIQEKEKKLNMNKKECRDYFSLITSGKTNVEIDDTGKIIIPKNLIEYAGLKKEIFLEPMLDYINIWEKGEYDKYYNNISINQHQLSEEIASKYDL